ncbi:Gfo/Idh/MocA family protein [Tichowtungia aerotolerans]|uniref:Gfo/Idh/MocA family oxidoreductase n=1 Tax=Tichowtungia aerotolerans TaxID=2697043 RepID=A0A6P1M3H7_9BACT|nr:Gfo/Idh/MocA family oxidoreductase [Tichowtungia aerotolerans]QHI69399.1 Gfo/Idh/MocA family oxidoreductase [Tichowtungia aerotolerans]
MTKELAEKKIKIGLVGCGFRIWGVVRHMASHPDFKNVEVTHVFDPDPEYGTIIRDEWAPELQFVDSYEEILRNPEIDWVMIGSWNCFHAEQVIAAFEAGKHVFCEKPLATQFEDCVAMRKAWRESGRQFVIGFTLRYSPHYRKIKELVVSGAIGDLVSFEFNETISFDHGGYIMGGWRGDRSRAGTHLLEKCSHDIDIVNWIVDAPVARAASFGGLDFFTPENEKHMERIGASPEGKQAYRAHVGGRMGNPFTAEKSIIDNQVAILEYKNGVRATFHANCNAAIIERRMYLCGTEGTLRADVIQGKVEVQRIGYDIETETIRTNTCNSHGGGDAVLGKELLDCMVSGAEPVSSLDDGFRAAITCFAIDDAMDSRQVVNLDTYWQQAGFQPLEK